MLEATTHFRCLLFIKTNKEDFKWEAHVAISVNANLTAFVLCCVMFTHSTVSSQLHQCL